MRSDYFCNAVWPGHPLSLQCTKVQGHVAKHQHGHNEWTDDQAADLWRRADAAAADAADRARAAVLNGQTAGPVTIGANRAQRRSSHRPNDR